jgi:hypothetical protein
MRSVIPAATALVCAIALAACGSNSSSSSGTGTSSSSAAATTTPSSSSQTATTSQPAVGFEGVPLQTGPALAPASTTGTAKVDGITCGSSEQLAYHIHTHLAVFRNGQAYTLPAGVGIPGSQAESTNQGPIANGGSCIYWLHTHTTDGIIHIESPTKRIYTLGDFFDVWRQPLSHNQVGSLHGATSAFVNGKPWKKAPRDIPLLPHADIQLEIGQPTPPIVTVNWSQTQL